MAFVRSFIWVKTANEITGSITFSSSWPAEAASITVVSRPIARKEAWFVTSGITGFTLPGMMEEPGWRIGRLISERPVRGPEASRRISLQTFVSFTARLLTAEEIAT